MKSIVINGTIVTMNQNLQVLENCCLAFTDKTITYIGEKPPDLEHYDQIIDAKGAIVLPGLINTHGHSPMTLLRGLGDDLPLQDWLEKKIWPKERTFNKEHIEWGSKLAIVEMLKSGTTAFSDMYIFMDTVAESVVKSGIRANLSRGIIGFGTEEGKKAKVIEAKSFAKEWHKQADGRITTMLSPHSLYTCEPDLVAEIKAAADELGLPVQIHLSETALEVERHIAKYGIRPTEHLRNLGFFNDASLVAHAVHLNSDELRLLQENRVKVSHNPGSNLKLGSGIAPISEMLKMGINVSLGTDGAASNNNLDMFEEVRLAALIHKGSRENPLLISAEEALSMATINGAEALFIAEHTGSLEVGKRADFLILNQVQAHLQPLYNPISQIVYSASGRDVRDVFLDGKQIVSKGEVLTLDEEQIIYQVKRLTEDWR